MTSLMLALSISSMHSLQTTSSHFAIILNQESSTALPVEVWSTGSDIIRLDSTPAQALQVRANAYCKPSYSLLQFCNRAIFIQKGQISQQAHSCPSPLRAARRHNSTHCQNQHSIVPGATRIDHNRLWSRTCRCQFRSLLWAASQFPVPR